MSHFIKRSLPYVPIISTGWSLYTFCRPDGNRNVNTKARSILSEVRCMPKAGEKVNRRVNQIRAGLALTPLLGNLLVGGFDLFCYLRGIEKGKTLYWQATQMQGENAEQLLRQAVQLDHKPALILLGWTLLFDPGLARSEKSSKEGIDLLELAYKNGDYRAATYLSHVYRYGTDGVEKDERKEKTYLEAAAEKNDPQAIKLLGPMVEEELRYASLTLICKKYLFKTPTPDIIDDEWSEEELKVLKSLKPVPRPSQEELDKTQAAFDALRAHTCALYTKGAKGNCVESMVSFAKLFIGEYGFLEPTEEEKKQVVFWLEHAIHTGNYANDSECSLIIEALTLLSDFYGPTNFNHALSLWKAAERLENELNERRQLKGTLDV